jgi:hypothetical protein
LAGMAPQLVQTATALAAALLPLVGHFTQMLPVALKLAGTLMQLGQAINAAQVQILGAVVQAFLPLLPVLVTIGELVGTLARLLSAVLTPVLAVIGPLIQIALTPLTIAFQVLGTVLTAFVSVLNLLLQPLTAVMDEMGAIVGEVVGLLGGALGSVFREFAGVLTVLQTPLRLAVALFSTAMEMVVKAIRFVADTVRNLFGLEVRNRNLPQSKKELEKPDGMAMREASRGSIEEFINKAQQAAFSSGGKQEDPVKQTATATQQINNKFDGLIGEIKGVREFVQKIYDRIPGREAVTSAAGDLVAGMTGGGILNRMITG